MGGVVKTLRRSNLLSRSVFSTAGSFGLSAICAQSSTIVHFCGLFRPLSKGNFRHKMTTTGGNRGQLWTSTLSPHLLSPRLDFPKISRTLIRALRGKNQASLLRISSPTQIQMWNQQTCGLGVENHPDEAARIRHLTGKASLTGCTTSPDAQHACFERPRLSCDMKNSGRKFCIWGCHFREAKIMSCDATSFGFSSGASGFPSRGCKC